MISSYSQNNFGEVFSAIIDAFKPINVVELGVLHGYSTLHMAQAIKKNGRGIINAYDLFEDYPYKHSNYEQVKDSLKECDNIILHKQDAWQAHLKHVAVDLLHVDLSNTGETVKKIIDLWDGNIIQGGVILFEGGTEERDNVEWMKKYGARPIKPEIESNKIIQERYVYGTYLKYPGLTMLLKKR